MGRDTVEEALGRDLEWVAAEALVEAEALAEEAQLAALPGPASEVVPAPARLVPPPYGNQGEARVDLVAGAEQAPVAEVELEPEQVRAQEVAGLGAVLVQVPALAGSEVAPAQARE